MGILLPAKTSPVVVWARNLVRDEIAKKLFWLVLAGISAALYVVAGKYQGNDPAIVWVPSVAFTLLLIGCFSYYLYTRLSFATYYYPRVKPHYTILQKTYRYVVNEKDELIFSREIKIKARHDNVERYLDKFVWTGGAAATPQPGPGCATTTAEVERVGIWTFYSTVLECSLMRGEEAEFTVVWPPLTNWRQSKPFVSASSEEPTKSIKFVVDVPADSLRDEVAYFEEMRSIDSNYAFKTKTDLKFDRGRIEVEVAAKLYRYYRLRWSWAGGNPVGPLPGNTET
ncbi:hypothetical protein [Nocardia asteroides]|uniref:hypothetical protein n=1 Tax=Nocardia asteroides TaxID=1824 RepID=UPI001E5980FE|nr:hypothetical protein [Nocardia asteroides]UGT64417.1 hypothetical protein LTT61_14500 [Nocardia asteroides]